MRSWFLISVLALGFAATGRPADAADVRMYVRHEVTDYAAWRKAYDGFDAPRRKLGGTAQAGYQSAHNPNAVTVTPDFRSPDKAQSFAASAPLKSAMRKRGVK